MQLAGVNISGSEAGGIIGHQWRWLATSAGGSNPAARQLWRGALKISIGELIQRRRHFGEIGSSWHGWQAGK